MARRARLQAIAAGLTLNDHEVGEAMAGQVLGGQGEDRFASHLGSAIGGYARVYDQLQAMPDVDVTAAWIRRLHRELFHFSKDDERHCGNYRGSPLRFPPPGGRPDSLIGSAPVRQIDGAVQDLVSWWNRVKVGASLSPVFQVAAFAGRFLIIAPFAKGNGRLCLLLAAHLLRQCGHDYLRFAALEGMLLRAKSWIPRVLGPRKSGDADGDPSWESVFDALAWPLEACLRDLVQGGDQGRIGPSGLSPTGEKILAAFDPRDALSIRDLVARTGLNRNTLKLHAKRLARAGLLRRKGAGRGACYERTSELTRE